MGGKGSLTLLRIRGIPVRLHYTFLIILPYIAWVISQATPALAKLAGVESSQLLLPPFVLGIALAIGLFVCVLIHEFAHVIVGVRAGGKVDGVTLMMVGGVSEMTEFPQRPIWEAAMAVAGPLASLLIAFAGYAGYLLLQSSVPDLRFALHYLAYMNLALAIFNVVPAFPMDGGRILRALLSMVMNRVSATRVAAWVGQVFALIFLFVGLFNLNWVLVLIGGLVMAGARAEVEMVRSSALMSGLKVEQAMSKFPPVMESDESLNAAVERMHRELKTTCFVVSQGVFVGAIIASEAQRAERRLSFGRVMDVTRRDVPRLYPSQDLTSAKRILQASGLEILPVTQGDLLVGAVSEMTIDAALQMREGDKAELAQARRREAT